MNNNGIDLYLEWPGQNNQSEFIAGLTGGSFNKGYDSITLIMCHSKARGLHFVRLDKEKAVQLRNWLSLAIDDVWGE